MDVRLLGVQLVLHTSGVTHFDAGTVACPFCAERIQSNAAVCRFCGRQVPVDCAGILRLGTQYVLGRLTSGGFGVWDLSSGSALVAQYPDTPPAWAEAVRAFDVAESKNRPSMVATAPQVRSSRGAMAWLVVFAIVVGLYQAVHIHKYEGCMITPSIFAWPSECL